MRNFIGSRAIKEVKTFPCKFCGLQIYFDPDRVNDYNKMIPIGADDRVHKCKSPNNPRNNRGAQY
jgi:hypothetical protein